ncbi:glucose-6-phosphate isomerase [Tenacibaculum sp. 190524A02b]|uniref:glucose-6-phosphate isomerase n=1 Tax=Tenacibaculum vairaonense TaxID=3137860 RepID=UPI0031FAB950
MALKNTNPTQTIAWKKLEEHFQEAKHYQLKKLFQEENERATNYKLQVGDLSLDYSKNHFTSETLAHLVALAKELNLKDAIEKYFTGAVINQTENRAVLHTALRSTTDEVVLVDGKEVKPKVQTTLRKIKAFSNKVISGKWKGFTGKSVTDVVNIGIGGSDLGPNMVVDALKFYKNKLNTHFVSNVDGDHLHEIINTLNPETTLFVIVSKSFTTQETITNANTIRDWFLKSATVFDVAKHFVAVSTNLEAVTNFGIDKKNIFPMWDWVGGRFSLWSAVGLTISLALGFDNFKALLNGAEKMDLHFRNTPFEENMPVIMALLGVWYTNFFKAETEAVLSYAHYLQRFPEYLQQVSMESNGKGVDRNGEPINYQTGAILWGGVGTNIQHSFMQLVHQGTKNIPVDFIGVETSLHADSKHHEILMANFYAQSEALAFGKTKQEAHLELKMEGKMQDLNTLLPYKVFEGNRQSNTILLKKLSPETLGMLISAYEHKVFTQGVLWNIYSFDQFGVELGKVLAKKILESHK